ncbi:MAG: tRNA pseudouridine(38-40) synthase TruA [bacterium]|nr:tRNA pseudouridine(38-40) synthase TruA [bacterium]
MNDEGNFRRGSDGDFRLMIDLAYAGEGFLGWQIQPRERTVQGELAAACSRLLGRPVVPVGAGRTDRGVHARGQVAHLSVRTEPEVERLQRALSGVLPDDMNVSRVRRVSPDFDARRGAESRHYSYSLFLGRDLFRAFCWQVDGPLDRAVMDRAADDLLGAHDCTSFCKTRSLRESGNVCEVDVCRFDWRDDSAIFHVRANRFLHHMVRNVVGTLVEVGRGLMPADAIPAILAARDRAQAGRMAPATGLFLEEVRYPAHLLDPAWRDPASPALGPSVDVPDDRHPEGESS